MRHPVRENPAELAQGRFSEANALVPAFNVAGSPSESLLPEDILEIIDGLLAAGKVDQFVAEIISNHQAYLGQSGRSHNHR